MIPQSDDYPTVIEGAIRALLENGQDAGRRRLIAIAYPIQELPKRPSLGRALMARVYLRDSFICRYCGGRTILTAVMELLATIYPDIFPFHPNWKGGSLTPR